MKNPILCSTAVPLQETQDGSSALRKKLVASPCLHLYEDPSCDLCAQMPA